MKYKLVCLDIDGTLLDDEKKIPDKVKVCLRDLSDRGVRIALASGRMPAGIEIIEKELGIQCIKICNAGTYILMDEECIAEEHLTTTDMRNIFHVFAEKHHVPLWIFQGRRWFVTGLNQYIEAEIKIIPCQPGIVEIEQLAEKWDKENLKPNKLLLAADPKMIDTIYREMKDDQMRAFDMARSADSFIEIFPRGIDKGTALKAVCQKLHIDLQETIAIGDQELDIPMVKAAGVGIAMGNAITELKEEADFITKSNNEAGIVYALEHYFNG